MQVKWWNIANLTKFLVTPFRKHGTLLANSLCCAKCRTLNMECQYGNHVLYVLHPVVVNPRQTTFAPRTPQQKPRTDSSVADPHKSTEAKYSSVFLHELLILFFHSTFKWKFNLKTQNKTKQLFQSLPTFSWPPPIRLNRHASHYFIRRNSTKQQCFVCQLWGWDSHKLIVLLCTLLVSNPSVSFNWQWC